MMNNQEPQRPYIKHLDRYISYIIRDIGNPPDIDKAKKLSNELKLDLLIYDMSTKKLLYESSARILKKMQAQFHFAANYDGAEEKDAFQKIFFSKVFKDLSKSKIDISGKIFWKRPFLFYYHPNSSLLYIFSFNREAIWFRLRGPLALLFASIALVIIIAYLLYRKILSPIREIDMAVQILKSGNFEHRIQENIGGELGDLARSFNSMTVTIDQMIKAREIFLRNISHELRSPLTRIRVALESVDNSPFRQSIREDIDFLSGLIQELLESQRIQSPHGSLSLRRTEMSSLIRQAIEKCGKEHSRKIIFSPSSPLYWKVDAERFILAVKNILENSIKNPSSGDLRIVIRMRIEKNRKLKITIADNGRGIEKENLEYVFEPFYKIEKKRESAELLAKQKPGNYSVAQQRGLESGGFGLGLSLVKSILEAHDGRVFIKSRAGKGTAFHIELRQ